MKTLKNTGTIRIGIPGPAIVLEPGDSLNITDSVFEALQLSGKFSRRVEEGTITVGPLEDPRSTSATIEDAED